MTYRKSHIKPKIKNLRPKKKFFKRPLFWIFIGILLISSALYFILFFSRFQIQNIIVSGNEKIKSQEIENTARSFTDIDIISTGIFNVSSRSIFIADANYIVKNLLSKFPLIEKIEAHKKLPNSLFLTVEERKRFAVFCPDFVEDPRLQSNRDQSGECFYIDKNGVIFERVSILTQSETILEKPSDLKAELGVNVIEKNIAEVVYRVKNSLKNNFQIGVREVLVSNPLIFTTSESWQIYFDPTSDIDLQITKMNLLLKDEISADARKKLQYIYLQYKDRAYYK